MPLGKTPKEIMSALTPEEAEQLATPPGEVCGMSDSCMGPGANHVLCAALSKAPVGRAAQGANFMQWFKKQIWSRKPDFAEDEDDLDQFAMDILRYLGK